MVPNAFFSDRNFKRGTDLLNISGLKVFLLSKFSKNLASFKRARNLSSVIFLNYTFYVSLDLTDYKLDLSSFNPFNRVSKLFCPDMSLSE